MAVAVETKKTEGEPEVRMSFGEHLQELRSRLIKAIVALSLAVVGALCFYKQLYIFITRPHFAAMETLKVPLGDQPLMAMTYGATMIWSMKLAFIVGLFVASPIVGYQIWAFISAG